jgi:hypothetical protein
MTCAAFTPNRISFHAPRFMRGVNDNPALLSLGAGWTGVAPALCGDAAPVSVSNLLHGEQDAR